MWSLLGEACGGGGGGYVIDEDMRILQVTWVS